MVLFQLLKMVEKFIELIDIENQIRSLYEMLKSNYNNALLNLSSQEIKVKLFDNVYSNEEKKLNYKHHIKIRFMILCFLTR